MLRKAIVVFAMLILGVVGATGFASASPALSGDVGILANCTSAVPPGGSQPHGDFGGSSKTIACGKCYEKGLQLRAEGDIGAFACTYYQQNPTLFIATLMAVPA